MSRLDDLLTDLTPQARPEFQQTLEDELLNQFEQERKEKHMSTQVKHRTNTQFPLIAVAAVLVTLMIGVGVLVATQLSNQGPSLPVAGLIEEEQEPTPTPFPTQELTQIVVAVQNIPRGTTITPDMVRLQPFPIQATPFNAVQNVEDAVGQVARTDFYVEQPLLNNLLIEDLEALEGPTATVRISRSQLDGDVEPGDRIDVYITLTGFDIQGDETLLFLPELAEVQNRDYRRLYEMLEINPIEIDRQLALTVILIEDALVIERTENTIEGIGYVYGEIVLEAPVPDIPTFFQENIPDAVNRYGEFIQAQVDGLNDAGITLFLVKEDDVAAAMMQGR
jgi:flagella basal body P-ring formation protein FlgA